MAHSNFLNNMSLTKREKTALSKFLKTYTAELDKLIVKKPVDLSIKTLSAATPKVFRF